MICEVEIYVMGNLLSVNIENAVEDGGLFIFGIEDSQMVTYIKV